METTIPIYKFNKVLEPLCENRKNFSLIKFF